MTITQVVQSSGNVEKLLANLGRKRHSILGDGNCFFRALSFIVNDTEDFHSTVRANIVLFAELNSSFFSKYCTSSRIDTHIQSMKWERVHATQMEAHVAASCLQRTLYIFTEKSGSGEYYWEQFDPIPLQVLKSHSIELCIPMHPSKTHIELCHVNRCHYDVVTLLNGELSSYPSRRLTTIIRIDLS